MEKMINLRDLLMHEVQDLSSAEEQIMDALPGMIDKANNASLKKALKDHLAVTEKQLTRLEEVKQLMMAQQNEESQNGEEKGWFSRLFGGGKHKCLGVEGLVKEGEKVMGEDMTPEVLDAAIIACAQKIEHYEICGYGTARAYARELNLGEVAELLEETLNEEYEADDLLTDLAVGRLNEKAEEGSEAGKPRKRNTSSRSTSSRGTSSRGTSSQSKSNGTAKKTGTTRSKKTATKSKSASRSTSRSGSRSTSRSKSK